MNVPKYIQNTMPTGGNIYCNRSLGRAVFASSPQEAAKALGVGWLYVYDSETFAGRELLMDGYALGEKHRRLCFRELAVPIQGQLRLSLFALDDDNNVVLNENYLSSVTGVIERIKKHRATAQGNRYYVYLQMENLVWGGEKGVPPEGIRPIDDLPDDTVICSFTKNDKLGNAYHIGDVSFCSVPGYNIIDDLVYLSTEEGAKVIIDRTNFIPLTDLFSLSFLELGRKYGKMVLVSFSKRDPFSYDNRSHQGAQVFFNSLRNGQLLAYGIEKLSITPEQETGAYISPDALAEFELDDDEIKGYRLNVGRVREKLQPKVFAFSPGDSVFPENRPQDHIISHSDQSALILFTEDGTHRKAIKMRANNTITPYIIRRLQAMENISDIKLHIGIDTNLSGMWHLRKRPKNDIPVDAQSIAEIISFIHECVETDSLPSVWQERLHSIRFTPERIAGVYLGLLCLDMYNNSRSHDDYNDSTPIPGLYWNGEHLETDINRYIVEHEDRKDELVEAGKEKWYALDPWSRTCFLFMFEFTYDVTHSIDQYYSVLLPDENTPIMKSVVLKMRGTLTCRMNDSTITNTFC